MECAKKSSSCCERADCCERGVQQHTSERWIVEYRLTKIGEIPLVSTKLQFADHVGCWKARWGIRRMKYRIQPGLYGVGNPDKDSIVLVTANYKMSFDKLRQELKGIDAWILVLDTKGINVWCAAGKGTFGTNELVHRISDVQLERVVVHRRIIIPQLGGPGVAAHIVQKETGFRVKYGPVGARDLKDFLKNNMNASRKMREVKFRVKDRMVLIPMEFIPSLKIIPLIFVLLMLIHAIGGRGFINGIFIELSLFLIAVLTGTVLVELLLPWIPFRSLAMKGWILGLFTVFIGTIVLGISGFDRIAYLFLLPPLSSFFALNFTGSTPYTSLSGVQKETLIGIPLMIVSVVSGIVIKLI